jgi:hypothetical protein
MRCLKVCLNDRFVFNYCHCCSDGYEKAIAMGWQGNRGGGVSKGASASMEKTSLPPGDKAPPSFTVSGGRGGGVGKGASAMGWSGGRGGGMGKGASAMGWSGGRGGGMGKGANK